jgi:CRP-like cAMP-binding protein
MDTNKYVVDVADLDLFARCTPTELRKIRSLMTYIEVPKDQVLVREGRTENEFIVITRGTARLTRETNGGVTKVADVGSGDHLGEMTLLSGSRWPATAAAATDLALLVSSASEFRSILQIAPSVADKLSLSSAERGTSLAVAA